MNTTVKIFMPILAVGALVIGGCSSASTPAAGPGTSRSAPAAVFNDTDVSFLEQMYPHHSQAIDMAKMVPTRSTNPQVLALATGIEGAQAPEMNQMVTLLASFGKPAPTTTRMGSMTGMMSDSQMSNLQMLTGAAFDHEWLTLMIAHHTGAVDMATTELAQGSNSDTKALATNIAAAQQKEITQMTAMLAGA